MPEQAFPQSYTKRRDSYSRLPVLPQAASAIWASSASIFGFSMTSK
jgi:hypothetical protein